VRVILEFLTGLVPDSIRTWLSNIFGSKRERAERRRAFCSEIEVVRIRLKDAGDDHRKLDEAYSK
jgi:hypothetical protein